MRRLLVVVLFALLASAAWGAPDLDGFRDVAGVRIYPDPEKSDRFYLAPTAPQLNTSQGAGYGLDVFRYVGTKAAGDQGAFRVRGVLSLSWIRERSPAQTASIRRAIRAEGISSPKLTSMPVSRTTVRLLYGGLERRWDFENRGFMREIRLPLDPVLSEVLWEAVEAGQIQVSMVLEETLAGVRRVDGDWRPDVVAQSQTLPVALDMSAHPEAFDRIDLGGRQQRGYTGVDIFCFDFIEGLADDLYAKQVEVSIPTPGRNLVEQVEFRAGGDYRSRIDFPLSRDLNSPYRYRVIRIRQDGTRSAAPWREKHGDTMLDVTAYPEDGRTTNPDPNAAGPAE
jgi:hypothetical protein